MFVGGKLIRRFDGFRRLCRRAAEEYHLALAVTEADMLLANRILAGLGGPPAASEIRGRFEGDTLALLLLFCLTQDLPVRVGLLGETEPTMGKLKSLVHLFGHAAYPLLTGRPVLPFQEVVRELGAGGAQLKPVVRYDDQDGEPLTIDLLGATGRLGVGSEAGPYTLAVMLGEGAGLAPLAPAEGGLHPVVLLVG
ncbi:MAG TPA: hypothetical protein VK464_24640 [Symbiobacteriaceae bacterium]|jgi:hypothetical protein|nr:hypothetical protein [Symbiobacteriaceae bacterium]